MLFIWQVRSPWSVEVVSLEDILLHEEHDEAQTEKLVQAIRRDGMQRHPVILACDKVGPLVHLDGANRIAALKRLGCRSVAAQLMDYADPAAVHLDTWLHLAYLDQKVLLNTVPKWPVCAVEKLNSAWVSTPLAQGEVVAVIMFVHGEVFVLRSRSMKLVDRVEAMRQLMALYAEPPMRAILPRADLLSGIQTLLSHTPQANAGIAFAPLSKADVITLARNLQIRLPAGVTRHIITCGRLLHINTPLTLLQADLVSCEKTAQLRAMLASKRYRVYSEPTIQYESC